VTSPTVFLIPIGASPDRARAPRSASKTTVARPLAQTRNKTFKYVYDLASIRGVR
jgi:hypothetical protein